MGISDTRGVSDIMLMKLSVSLAHTVGKKGSRGREENDGGRVKGEIEVG